jgi:electron transfer flavoprotein beta subunit
MGPLQAEDEVWRLMGLGADQLCHVELTRPEEVSTPLDSWSKASLLAQAIRSVGGEVVLCGKESIDRQNGLVAANLAHQLQRPFVSGIMDLAVESPGETARITQNAGKGRRWIVECTLPAVFSVELFSGTPVLPAYASVRSARHQPVAHLIFDPGAIAPKTRCVGIDVPRPRTKPVLAPESSLPAFDRIQTLLAGSKIQKKGKTVFGAPEAQVDEIIDFLAFNGFLQAPDKPTP